MFGLRGSREQEGGVSPRTPPNAGRLDPVWRRCLGFDTLDRDGKSRRWSDIRKIVARKLDMLDAAAALRDLLVPPGNRLEASKAGRAGQHSIRVDDQWRICFTWTAGGPERVEIADYHQEGSAWLASPRTPAKSSTRSS